MKFNKTVFKLGFAFLCACVVSISCTKTDESIDNREHGYGYVQFKLYKAATRADELDYLRDAYKITLALRKDNQTINQAVLVEAAGTDISEYGLRTEKLKLMVGEYELTGYTIHNALDEKILTSSPLDIMMVEIKQSRLTVQSLEVSVVPRGSFRFKLIKDLSKVEESITRADEGLEYAFDEVAKADLILRNQRTGRSFSINGLKSEFVMDGSGGSYLRCDSIVEAEAVTYKLERYTLWDMNGRVLTTADTRADEVYYEVVDNETLEAELPVLISPVAPYIKDFIILKKIWEDMHGEEWSWSGGGFPEGANWNFDKDIDLWGAQPGVYVHTNRRIAAINFGKFNPRGPVSESLGELDALVELWFGLHSDDGREDMPDSYREGERYYSTWERRVKGQHVSEYRWELNLEEMRARHPEQRPSELFATNIQKPEAIALWNSRRPLTDNGKKPVAVRPYAAVDPGYLTNRITSLPKSIGKLTQLEHLYIANGLITEIPAEIGNCISLTDLEIYNCPKMTKFPREVGQLPLLTMLNISQNPAIPAREIEAGLDAVFNGPAKDYLQILYCVGNNVEVFPASARNLKKLGLLDLYNNKIHTMPAMGDDVSLVQCYLDNNRLTSLPKNFYNTDDLESLSVSNNLLTEFPNIFDMDTEFYMGSLDFSYNKIRKIAGYNMQTMELEPDASGEVFKGLKAKTLNLSGNMLEGGFPAAFSLSKSDISQYNLSYNELDSIGAKGLLGLSFTTALDLSSNKIETAPTLEQILIGQEMPFLTGIDLSYNAFTEFPTTLFNGYGITTFFFSSQFGRVDGDVTYPCFSKWPDGIEQYAGLLVLKMDYNDIRQIRIFPAKLNYLNIVGNDNLSVTIPTDVCTRLINGTFGMEYETSQKGITGCPALGIEN